MVSSSRKEVTTSREIEPAIRMASNLIRVKEAGAYKLRMPNIRGWVTKGSEVDVEEVMMRFGWLREREPGGQD